MNTPRRIDQWLSNLGYCSRRDARGWLKDGRVTSPKGLPWADSSERVQPEELLVDGERLDHPHGLLILMNKPLGAVCSQDSREGQRVYDLVPPRWLQRSPALTTIGRLDRDTGGLLLLTDQTELVHRLTSPKRKVAKRYRATLAQTLTTDAQTAAKKRFADGDLQVDGEPCAPAELQWLSSSTADLILTEGRFHQVRRMFTEAGCNVLELTRLQLGRLELPIDLAAGKYTELPLNFEF